jgi:putative endonuclease
MKTNQERWYIYLAECKDKSLYCGITNNIVKRFWQHNGIKAGGAKYTKGRRPVTLLAYHSVADKSQALLLEITLKKLPKQKKLAFLLGLQQQAQL